MEYNSFAETYDIYYDLYIYLNNFYNKIFFNYKIKNKNKFDENIYKNIIKFPKLITIFIKLENYKIINF